MMVYDAMGIQGPKFEAGRDSSTYPMYGKNSGTACK